MRGREEGRGKETGEKMCICIIIYNICICMCICVRYNSNIHLTSTSNAQQLKSQNIKPESEPDTYKTYTPQPSTPIKHAGSEFINRTLLSIPTNQTSNIRRIPFTNTEYWTEEGILGGDWIGRWEEWRRNRRRIRREDRKSIV